MSQAIYTATSGARTYGMRLDMLTHNLSNINTIGFKQDRAVFRTYMPHSNASEKVTSQETGIAHIREVQPPFNMSNTLQVFDGTQTDFSLGQLRPRVILWTLPCRGTASSPLKHQMGSNIPETGISRSMMRALS